MPVSTSLAVGSRSRHRGHAPPRGRVSRGSASQAPTAIAASPQQRNPTQPMRLAGASASAARQAQHDDQADQVQLTNDPSFRRAGRDLGGVYLAGRHLAASGSTGEEAPQPAIGGRRRSLRRRSQPGSARSVAALEVTSVRRGGAGGGGAGRGGARPRTPSRRDGRLVIVRRGLGPLARDVIRRVGPDRDRLERGHRLVELRGAGQVDARRRRTA